LLNRFAGWWPKEEEPDRRSALATIALPEAFAALAVLRRAGTPSEIEAGVTPILEMRQPFVPTPEGRELWLQRRAILLMYDRVGIGSLLIRYAVRLRPALFRYLALMRDLRSVERSLLVGLAREHDDNEDSCLLVEELA